MLDYYLFISSHHSLLVFVSIFIIFHCFFFCFCCCLLVHLCFHISTLHSTLTFACIVRVIFFEAYENTNPFTLQLCGSLFCYLLSKHIDFDFVFSLFSSSSSVIIIIINHTIAQAISVDAQDYQTDGKYGSYTNNIY